MRHTLLLGWDGCSSSSSSRDAIAGETCAAGEGQAAPLRCEANN